VYASSARQQKEKTAITEELISGMMLASVAVSQFEFLVIRGEYSLSLKY